MGESKMPHIRLPENLGIRYAVLPGDPARAERAAGYLKDAKLLAFNREYKSYSGLWNGVPVLLMSTGMGGPSMAIAVEELRKTGVEAAVRIGSCGALQPEAGVGDLVMVEAAVRDEGTIRLLQITGCLLPARRAQRRLVTGSISALQEAMTACIGMTIHQSMRTGQKKVCWRLIWKLRHYLWLAGSVA